MTINITAYVRDAHNPRWYGQMHLATSKHTWQNRPACGTVAANFTTEVLGDVTCQKCRKLVTPGEGSP